MARLAATTVGNAKARVEDDLASALDALAAAEVEVDLGEATKDPKGGIIVEELG